MLQVEVMELRDQMEKDRKKSREELSQAKEKAKVEVRRVSTERENQAKRAEAAC